MKNNKKGFTLVELLAVIVILALIMGIAVVSIGSVITTSKEKVFRETAASILNGVRQRIFIEGKGNGYYTFTNKILEKGGITSPYGKGIKYVDSCSTSLSTSVNDVCVATTMTCSSSVASSFVEVSNGTYKICLVDQDGYYVFDTDTNLVNNTASIITPSP